MSGKDVAYDLRAERHLVVGCGIAKQNRRVVEDAFGKNMAPDGKYADFGLSGARVDYEKSVHGEGMIAQKMMCLNRAGHAVGAVSLNLQ